MLRCSMALKHILLTSNIMSPIIVQTKYFQTREKSNAKSLPLMNLGVDLDATSEHMFCIC